ncbi:type II toxin-antitoxin system HipA family toxin [Caulobacter endophyticus]|uniref:type II toxin-antitoxin system HipA family toxin n=1 Tax=Caulobacter endophyticus TaxID=2172652 RepID=UPI00241027EA|nr:type II toxin-antitoxin system HipA family toxin [Caulobacter endophyticus]MDG2528049.1 type II toxin-antitoxin system HipA family toxin [Caulobacter endophyticus]
MVDILQVWIGDRRVGAITALGGDRSIFTFDDDYTDDAQRPTLSLSFKSATGGLIRDHRSTQTRLLPYFSNLLPEGRMRDYLAERAGVKSSREFFLLWALGADLPGATRIMSGDGEGPPVGAGGPGDAAPAARNDRALRFSLAGVQLKFSALSGPKKGLTIPVHGNGGDWIVKLPSAQYAGVSENEYAMMSLACAIGIETPEIKLLNLDDIDGLPADVGRLEGGVFATRRFDRLETGERVQTEDFAQVFGVYPEDKYERASYRSIAGVIWRETGERGLTEFIRRLVFSALIGNADMHLKNWSLLYRDGINATLAPAYDFVATQAYIPDDKAALKVSRSKRWSDLGQEELIVMSRKAGLPEELVLSTAAETVAAFREVWGREQGNLPIDGAAKEVVETQLKIVPLARA